MRVQIDQVNTIMDNMGVKEKVYEELTKQLKQQNKLDDEDPNEEEEEPEIFGLGGTLVEEYQKKL
jgi:hypothetical protein|tara:strand:+ start:508 stop:702 length:195 start_codon:yes stop_codon:yes gene_type:complete